MRLRDWLDADANRTIQQLARDADIAYPTAWKASQGKPVTYGVAKRLSAATGGEVSIDELCEPPPAEPIRVIDSEGNHVELPPKAASGES